jgi:TIR domain
VQVFLSYSSDDRAVAESIRSALKRQGVDIVPWEQVLKPGTYWASEIGRAIESADAFVVLLSKAAIESEWVQFEIASAIAAEARSDYKRILPILVEPGVRPPALLAPYLAVEATTPDEVDSVAKTFRRILTEAPTTIGKASEREKARQQLDSLRRALEDEETRHDAVTQRDRYRAVVATALVASLGAIIGVIFVAVQGEASLALLSSLLSAGLALAGAAVGFYFGSRSREHSE